MVESDKVLKATMVGLITDRSVECAENGLDVPRVNDQDSMVEYIKAGKVIGYVLCRVFKNGDTIEHEYKSVTKHQLKTVLKSGLIQVSNLRYIESTDSIQVIRKTDNKGYPGYGEYDYYSWDNNPILFSGSKVYLATNYIGLDNKKLIIYYSSDYESYSIRKVDIDTDINLIWSRWANAIQVDTTYDTEIIPDSRLVTFKQENTTFNMISDTIKEALEKLEKPMGIKEFMQICEEANLEGFLWWKDKLNDDYIEGIDKRARIFRTPLGMTMFRFEGMQDTSRLPKAVAGTELDPSMGSYALEEIIIDKDPRYPMRLINIPNKFYSLAPNFNKVTFENYANRISLEFLGEPPRQLEVSIPSDTETLNYYNPDRIKLDIGKCEKLSNLGASFRKCSTVDDLSGTNLKTIDSCYYSIEKPFDLVMPKNLEKFCGCVECNLLSLQFPANGTLKSIEVGSFSNCTISFKSLVIPEGVVKIASSCFQHLTELEEVTLPSTLEGLGANCFLGTSIKKIILPESLHRIGGLVPEISYEYLNKHSIAPFMFNETLIKDFKFEDSIKEIGRQAFLRCSGSFTIPTGLEVIRSEAFYEFVPRGDMVNLDLSCCKNLKVIEARAFECSYFVSVLLPDGLEEIDDNAFRYMGELKYIYIPNSVKTFGRAALQNFRSVDMDLIVYTQRGSKADKYCKNKNIRIKYVDTIDDVFTHLGIDSASKRKLFKLRMAIGADPKHSELFNGNYDGSIIQMHALYTTSQQVVQNLDIKLETRGIFSSNFSIRDLIPKDKYEELDRSMNSDYELINEGMMNGYINIITTLIDSNKNIVNKSFIDVMLNSKDGNIEYVWCHGKSKDKKVYTIEFKRKEKTYLLIFIEIGGKIVWSAMTNSRLLMFPYLPVNKGDIHGSVETKFVENSDYPVNRQLSKIVMPLYIGKAVEDVIKEQFILIGIDSKETVLSDMYLKYNAVLYSTVSENLVFCQADLSSRSELSISDIYSITFKKIIHRKELSGTLLQKVKSMFFDQSGIESLIETNSRGKDYLQELCMSPKAYDKASPSIEWEISDALQQLGLSDPTKLNKKALELILSTSFFKSGTIKLSSNRLKTVSLVEKIQIDNKMYSILTSRLKSVKKEFTTINKNGLGMVLMVKGGPEHDSDSIQVWYSYSSFNGVYKDIYGLADKSRAKHYYLDNDPVDLRDFECLGAKHLLLVLGEHGRLSAELRLCMCKATGVVFLLGRILDNPQPDVNSNFYKLFRYRNTKEALRACSWLKVLTQSSPLLNQGISNNDIADLVESIQYNRTDYNDNKLIEIRNAILKGAPNGFNTELKCQSFYDSVAKQPKNP